MQEVTGSYLAVSTYVGVCIHCLLLSIRFRPQGKVGETRYQGRASQASGTCLTGPLTPSGIPSFTPQPFFFFFSKCLRFEAVLSSQQLFP